MRPISRASDLARVWLSFIVESAVIIQERGSHFRLPSGCPHSHAHARRGRFESRRSSSAVTWYLWRERSSKSRRAMGKGRNRCDYQKKGKTIFFGGNRPENGHAPLDDSHPWCRRFVARPSLQYGRPTEIWSGRGAGSSGRILRGDVRRFPTFFQTWPAQRRRCAHRTARRG